MYNKTKRGLNLTAAILSIIVGSLEFIGGLVSIITVIGLAALMESGGAPVWWTAIIGAVLDIALGVAFVVLGALGCKKPVLENGAYKSTKKLDIAMIVLSVILFVFAIVSFALGTASVFLIISFILVMVIVGLKIAALCLKDLDGATSAVVKTEEPAASPKPLTIEGKINELKHLKELGVINDEQYNAAVEKVIKDYSV